MNVRISILKNNRYGNNDLVKGNKYAVFFSYSTRGMNYIRKGIFV